MPDTLSYLNDHKSRKSMSMLAKLTSIWRSYDGLSEHFPFLQDSYPCGHAISEGAEINGTFSGNHVTMITSF